MPFSKTIIQQLPRIPPNIFNAPFPVKPLILFCNKIITIRIFYKTVIRSETEIIVLTPTLSWNWRFLPFFSHSRSMAKKEHLIFFYFFLQTDKWSAKIMFARNAFVLFLHNTAFCKRKLHQITAELIFLWIIIISSNSSVATQKCEEAHFAPLR